MMRYACHVSGFMPRAGAKLLPEEIKKELFSEQ
jgi:hypothetical protein